MKWTLKDKIQIGSILPPTGSLLTKTLCRDIKEKLVLTVDEIKKSGLEQKEKENKTFWKTNIEIDIEFTKDELTLLKQSAHRVDKEENITDDNLELIEKLLK